MDYALPPEHLIFRLFDSVMEQEGQIAAWDWLSLEKPRMFAKALFGSDYPFGVLMVLQAYVWSLAFVYVFDTRKKCTREAIRSFLAQARTVQHRQLADRILTSLDLSDEARTLSQDVLELIQILVIEHGFDIGEGHLRHREEPPFVKLLERALHGRSWDTALTMWSPNSFGALVGSNSTLCDFSRRPVSSLDSEFASESDSDSTHEDFANLQPQSPGLN